MNSRFGSGQLVEEKFASLMLSCADQVGVIASVANFFAERGISLTACSEHIDDGTLFLRVQWELNDRWEDQKSFCDDFSTVSAGLAARFDVKFCDRRHSIGLLAASDADVLLEILNKIESNSFRGLDVAFIIACDESLSKLADSHGLPFFLVEQSDGILNQDRRLFDIIQRYKCDFLGLAQFPYRLQAQFLEKSACPVINTAPLSLVSDDAADPYLQAHQKGAKLLGASSFLLSFDSADQGGRVTNNDELASMGPIVHQATSAVKNGSSLADLRKQGGELEHAVFSSTLKALLEHKVLQHGGKAIVFD